MGPFLCFAVAATLGGVAEFQSPPDALDLFLKEGKVTTLGSARADGTLWAISWGKAGDRLMYAVFSSSRPRQGFEIPVRITTRSVTQPDGSLKPEIVTARLVSKNGVRLRLPFRVQLIEVTADKLRTSSRRVSLADFEAYLESNPTDYSLDEFLTFQEARNRKRAK